MLPRLVQQLPPEIRLRLVTIDLSCMPRCRTWSVLEPPVPLPRLAIQPYWHRRATHDPLIMQLRAAVCRAARA